MPAVEKIFGFVLPLLFNKPTKDKLLIFSGKYKDLPQTIKVTSPAFGQDEQIPWKYGGENVGDDVSPPLVISNLPQGTKSVVLVMQDLDVPLPSPIDHTIIYNLHADKDGTIVLAEGSWDSIETLKAHGANFGKAFRGSNKYNGPRPLVDHGKHNYYFEVFALDIEKIDPLLPSSEVKSIIAKHGLASGYISGWFERTSKVYTQQHAKAKQTGSK